MTRSEAYAEGFHDGRYLAERDIRDRYPRDFQEQVNRNEVALVAHYGGEGTFRAEVIGFARGYRDTWARWDAGTLTASMLEHAPLRAGR